MKCPKCGQPMTPLFFSVACDYCDGLKEMPKAEPAGWVTWKRGMDSQRLAIYRTKDAVPQLYNNMISYNVRQVTTPTPIVWDYDTNNQISLYEYKVFLLKADYLESIEPCKALVI